MASLILPTLQAAILRGLEKTIIPYPRSDSEYDKPTRDVLNKHKDLYISKTTREDRETFFQSVILVDIFNYWYKIHEVVEDIPDKELSQRIKVTYETLA